MVDFRRLMSFFSLDADEVLDLLGLQQRRSMEAQLLAGIGTFGAGLLLGSGIALLLAPKPGHALRADLVRRFERGGEAAQRGGPGRARSGGPGLDDRRPVGG